MKLNHEIKSDYFPPAFVNIRKQIKDQMWSALWKTVQVLKELP